LRQLFESEDGRGTIRRNLITRKTLARLVELAKQDGAAPAAKAPKTRKKAKGPEEPAPVSATSETASEEE
jgi:hypothetical protein